MKYNFDEVIDRRNTSCVKFDAVSERLGRNDFIPLWVADMDFLSPPCVIEALKKRGRTRHFWLYFCVAAILPFNYRLVGEKALFDG
jgi:bifunctional pyridoxal-dependent enzyme with beta-cystathionase and maltose regulon repressor activities